MSGDSERDGAPASDRRRFLKQATTAAIGFATAAGASGTAAARSAPGLREAYADPIRTEAAIEAHAGGLLSMLAEEGILDSADASALHTRRPVGYGDVAADREGTAFAQWDGDKADEIRSVRHVDDGVLSVVVEPETGRAYALFAPADETTKYVYDPEKGVFDASSASCCQSGGCTCTNYPCGSSGLNRLGYCEYCCPCGGADCYTDSYCGC